MIAILESRGLQVFTGAEGSVREACEAYLQGKLGKTEGCTSGGDCSGAGHHHDHSVEERGEGAP